VAVEASSLRSSVRSATARDGWQIVPANTAAVLYMLRDKISRRGFSDKTVKDYLSFGGAHGDLLSKRISRKKVNDRNRKMMEKDGEKEETEWRRVGLKMAEGGGRCHAGRILFSV